MFRRYTSASYAAATALILTALLVVSGVWQYRLIAAAVTAEREQQLRAMQSASSRFSVDAERELARAFNYFQVDRNDEAAPSRALEAAQVNWRQETGAKNIVKQLYLVEEAWSERESLHSISEHGVDPTAIPWPESLRVLHNYLKKPASRRWARWFPVGVADVPAAVGPLVRTERFTPDRPMVERVNHRRDLLIVVYDRQMVRDVLLSRLAQESLVSNSFPFEYRVVDKTNNETLLQSANVPQDSSAPAAQDPLFRSGFYLGFRMSRDASRLPPRDPDSPTLDTEFAARTWEVSMFHREGTLDAVANARRLQQLATSFSIIAVLGLTSFLAIWMARRVQRLAQQRLEFVASVTHELNTPLTSIHAAAQNLSAGVIVGPNEVRAYGNMIEEDSLRLKEMVDQVLTYASLAAAPLTKARKEVSVNQLVDLALSETEQLCTRAEMQIERSIPTELPALRTHPETVVRILRNLIVNAVIHGGSGRWLGVAAQRNQMPGDRREWLVITVSDRGPGIAASDRPHLFEPFYRGRVVDGCHSPGTGLGLSISRQLAERLGGKLTFESTAGAGSSFSLWLEAEQRSAA